VCLIVDTCVTHRLLNVRDADFAPVRESLEAGSQTIALGGHLLREYARYHDVVRFMAELARKGRLRVVRDAAVDSETENLRSAGTCLSNDAHLVALARVSGARILCTSDRTAARDFTRKELLSQPRGKVYRRAAHRHLLRARCSARC
jgi:predicted nucleic acid-binding protein